MLIFGAILNGAFAVFAMFLAGRGLGLTAFEPLAQLWTIWGLTATGLVFAFQQWEITRLTVYLNQGRLRMPRMPSLWVAATTVAVLVLAVTFRVDIFTSESLSWPLAAATLPLGTSLTGRSYAILAVRRRFGFLAVLSASENAVRLAATALLIAVGAPVAAFAITVPIGFLIPLLPILMRGDSAGFVQQESGRRDDARIPLLAIVGFSTNFLVFGGPLLLGIAGGSPVVVSALFLVLIPVRVPFLLANSLLPAVAVLSSSLANAGRFDTLRGWVRRGMGVGGGLAALGGAIGWMFADLISAVLLETDVIVPATYAMVFAAAGLCLVATGTNVLVISMDRTAVVAASWLLVVASGFVLAATGSIAAQSGLGMWMLGCAAVIAVLHASLGREPKADGATGSRLRSG